MKIKPMTKEKYIAWKATRGKDASKWNRNTCHAADHLIKKITLENFNTKAKTLVTEPETRKFLVNQVWCHFGSVEVDDLLIHLKAYPEWM